MTCRWKGRVNLQEYCCTCRFGTRVGCVIETSMSTRRNYNHGPYEFPKVAAA